MLEIYKINNIITVNFSIPDFSYSLQLITQLRLDSLEYRALNERCEELIEIFLYSIILLLSFKRIYQISSMFLLKYIDYYICIYIYIYIERESAITYVHVHIDCCLRVFSDRKNRLTKRVPIGEEQCDRLLKSIVAVLPLTQGA